MSDGGVRREDAEDAGSNIHMGAWDISNLTLTVTAAILINSKVRTVTHWNIPSPIRIRTKQPPAQKMLSTSPRTSISGTFRHVSREGCSHREAHAVEHALHALLLRNTAQPLCSRPRAQVMSGVAADGSENCRVGRIIVWPLVYLLQAVGRVLLCLGQPVAVQVAFLPNRAPAAASNSSEFLVT